VSGGAGASAERASALRSLLAPAAVRLGVAVEPFVAELAVYADELLRWNERINLTGARSLETLAREHLADSLALVPLLPAAPARWIDVGAGSGLPGIVLALARRELSAVLLEPSEKRRAFLAATLRSLGLTNVRVVGQKVLEHLEKGGAGAYDLAVSRAVFPLPEWLSVGVQLVVPGGTVLGLEGSARVDLPAEVERLPYDLGLGPRAIVRIRRR
jgi:16S rRNA (guanine527-N7)-methyltransferase